MAKEETPSMPIWLITGAAVVILVVGLVAGMSFGKPVIISLEESQRQSLIDDCEWDMQKLERECEREQDKMLDRLTERNQELIEHNKDLLEINENQNEDWQERFADLNQSIADLNCE